MYITLKTLVEKENKIAERAVKYKLRFVMFVEMKNSCFNFYLFYLTR